jgi:hypothetical protein
LASRHCWVIKLNKNDLSMSRISSADNSIIYTAELSADEIQDKMTRNKMIYNAACHI